VVVLLGWRVLLHPSLVMELPSRFMESIQHVVSFQLLDHTHELFDARSDPLAIKDSHQVVYERFLVRQRDQLMLALRLEALQHLLLILVHFEGPLEEFGIGLQILILALQQVVDTHSDHRLVDYNRSAKCLTRTELFEDFNLAKLVEK